MPTSEWIGKYKVVNHHLDVLYRALEPKDVALLGIEMKAGKGASVECEIGVCTVE